MSLASVIHHRILAPAKSDRIFLTIPVVPPDSRARGWTKSRFSLLANPTLVSDAKRRLSLIFLPLLAPEILIKKMMFLLQLSTAAAFGIGIGLKEGVGKASEFFAGYLLEQSLSVDNLFVFVLVFKYFKVPLMYQITNYLYRYFEFLTIEYSNSVALSIESGTYLRLPLFMNS